MVTIRKENQGDSSGIRYAVERAFSQADEAALVDALRKRNVITVSLVATVDGRIVGHILFTPVTVESNQGSFQALGLAPLAVLPEFQNGGIGSLLVRKGLEECLLGGHAAVFVLGHPEYYARFGFLPSTTYGIRYEGNVPVEAFMAIELRKGALNGKGGIVRFQPEFVVVE